MFFQFRRCCTKIQGEYFVEYLFIVIGFQSEGSFVSIIRKWLIERIGEFILNTNLTRAFHSP